MKKILAGVFAVALTIGLVSGSAYALFTDQVQVNNLAITTGNADLKISVEGPKGTFTDSFNQGPWLEENVYPGWEGDVSFWLKNESLSDIDLVMTSRLVSATGDWGTLANVLEVKIITVGGTYNSDWHTLSWWNAENRVLDGTLTPGQVKEMKISLRVPATAGNEIAQKWVSTNWVIDATQKAATE